MNKKAEKKPGVIVFDSGSDTAKRVIDAFRRRYPDPDKVELIVISTVPNGWKRDFSQLTDKAYLNTSDDWLFDITKINHLIMMEEDGNSRTASIEKAAEAIEALGVDVSKGGILPDPMHAWNELAIAKLAGRLGIRYTPVNAIEICNDKPALTKLLDDLRKREDLRDILQNLIIPREEVCSATDQETAKAQILQAITNLTREDREAGKDWKLMLKPTYGGGSLGSIEITHEDSRETILDKIDGHLVERSLMPSIGGPEISMLQQYIGGIEVGYHGIKNSDDIHHELTMKEMTPPPYCKEVSHYIDPHDPKYAEYRALVFPVMEKVFEALDIDHGHLNADIKIENGKICIVDAQARCGLGHPEMLNYVYSKPLNTHQFMQTLGEDFDVETMGGMAGPDGILEGWVQKADVEQLLVALSLDLENSDGIMEELRKLKATHAVTVDTLYPEGGWVIGHKPKYFDRMPGIFYLSYPDIKDGDYVPEMQSFLSTGGHITIGGWGPTLSDAVNSSNTALHYLYFAVSQQDRNAHPEYYNFAHPIQIKTKAGKEIGEEESEMEDSSDALYLREWERTTFKGRIVLRQEMPEGMEYRELTGEERERLRTYLARDDSFPRPWEPQYGFYPMNRTRSPQEIPDQELDGYVFRPLTAKEWRETARKYTETFHGTHSDTHLTDAQIADFVTSTPLADDYRPSILDKIRIYAALDALDFQSTGEQPSATGTPSLHELLQGTREIRERVPDGMTFRELNESERDEVRTRFADDSQIPPEEVPEENISWYVFRPLTLKEWRDTIKYWISPDMSSDTNLTQAQIIDFINGSPLPADYRFSRADTTRILAMLESLPPPPANELTGNKPTQILTGIIHKSHPDYTLISYSSEYDSLSPDEIMGNCKVPTVRGFGVYENAQEDPPSVIPDGSQGSISGGDDQQLSPP